MLNKKIVGWCLLGLGLILLLCSGVKVAANTLDSVGYNIQAVIPENQLDKTKTYFDLRVKPQQQQTLQVKLNNTSDEKSTFAVSVNQAYTGDRGFISYDQAVQPLKSQTSPTFKQIATYTKRYTVLPQTSKLITITLKMPAKEFSGQLLGGIHVKKVISQAAKKAGIVNQYGYILGLKLTENDQAVKRQVTLHGIKTKKILGKMSLVAQLDNPTNDAIGHLKYTGKIVKAKTDEKIREIDYDTGMQLAPNSRYNFALDWQHKKMQPGKYLYDLTVADALGNHWHFKKSFVISKPQAQKVNAVTITKSPATIPWLGYLCLLLLILLVSLLLWLLWKKRRKKTAVESSEK